jgi:flagellar secretion chaperone FliS
MTITQNDARTAYRGGAVSTATPAQLLIMLFERLALDAERGLRALQQGDNTETHAQLVHAQAIVTELQSTLQVEGMPAGRELMALYGYLQRRMIQANVSHDVRAGREVVQLTRHLRDTWKRAAELAARQ